MFLKKKVHHNINHFILPQMNNNAIISLKIYYNLFKFIFPQFCKKNHINTFFNIIKNLKTIYNKKGINIYI